MLRAIAAVVAVLVGGCGGAVEGQAPTPTEAALVSPATCVSDRVAAVCDGSLPVGYTVQFLDGDGGIAGGCTLADRVASCRVGDACQVVMAPDGRVEPGHCE